MHSAYTEDGVVHPRKVAADAVITLGRCVALNTRKVCGGMQAGKLELKRRLEAQLSKWAPLLQKFLHSADDQVWDVLSAAAAAAAADALLTAHSVVSGQVSYML